ncbi:hypothetical protein NNC19_18655 [Clostridium sp. SHJSY1]|uniref:hypothetical protein n=1 Tax=Clostridium sp. SHJSY1 TaxID=2942483 RepID=UPI0028769987|nr:hypothetical protein [Clostridium sp. SHJSY1]MDS0527714.1 hypothetical protein [Clostridium sp. SHJSY1]
MRIGNTLSYLNVHSPQKTKEVLDEIQNNSIKETIKEHTTNNYYNRSAENLEPYQTIYNNATLENNNFKSTVEQTDEEITYEMNKNIYDSEELSEKGIKFNSKEFFEWLEKDKKGSAVPYDAPPKIRKKLSDTLNKLKKENGIVWFRSVKALGRGLRDKDTKDPQSYLDICNNVIEKSKDMLTSIAMSGLNNSPIFQSTIITNKCLINVFTDIKSDINSYFSD